MHLVERAYALARSGLYASSRDLTRALRSEGFSRYEIDSHLGGRGMSRELGRLRRESAGVRSRPAGAAS